MDDAQMMEKSSYSTQKFPHRIFSLSLRFQLCKKVVAPVSDFTYNHRLLIAFYHIFRHFSTPQTLINEFSRFSLLLTPFTMQKSFFSIGKIFFVDCSHFWTTCTSEKWTLDVRNWIMLSRIKKKSERERNFQRAEREKIHVLFEFCTIITIYSWFLRNFLYISILMISFNEWVNNIWESYWIS